MKRFAFVALHAHGWPMREQCRLLGVSASGYYAWQKRVPLRQSSPRYPPGKWRLNAFFPPTLAAMASADCVRNCGAKATRPPRTTQIDPQAVAAANKLASWPAATAPSQVWVGNITYLALATGHWAYLARCIRT